MEESEDVAPVDASGLGSSMEGGPWILLGQLLDLCLQELEAIDVVLDHQVLCCGSFTLVDEAYAVMPPPDVHAKIDLLHIASFLQATGGLRDIPDSSLVDRSEVFNAPGSRSGFGRGYRRTSLLLRVKALRHLQGLPRSCRLRLYYEKSRPGWATITIQG